MIYDDFLPSVLPDVPGCPRALAIQHIRLAAIDFCEHSLCWRDELPAITADGSAAYAFNVSEHVEVVRLLSCQVGSDPYEVVPALIGRSAVRCEDTLRDLAWTPNRRDLHLYPAPSTGSVVVVCALKPSLESQDFPDDIGAQYREQIADGALARLFRMPKKDWTDLAQAADRRNQFNGHIHSAAAGAASSHGGALRVTPSVV